MRLKNHDYAGGNDDRFANFRGSLFLGIEPELGILMRVMDKFMRIAAFIRTGVLLVKGEAVEDAIEDSINYLILLKGMIIERRQKEAVVSSDLTYKEIDEKLKRFQDDFS